MGLFPPEIGKPDGIFQLPGSRLLARVDGSRRGHNIRVARDPGPIAKCQTRGGNAQGHTPQLWPPPVSSRTMLPTKALASPNSIRVLSR